MTVTFQKSLAAALVSGAVAFMTPVLLHAQATTAPTASGSATTKGAVSAPATSAGANAAAAAKVSPDSTNATTGAYGGMGTDQSTINNDVNKAKKKATSPMSSPNSMSSPNNTTTQPH